MCCSVGWVKVDFVQFCLLGLAEGGSKESAVANSGRQGGVEKVLKIDDTTDGLEVLTSDPATSLTLN